jgi:RNA polymerase sigma-70 factor, ECF subfamily
MGIKEQKSSGFESLLRPHLDRLYRLAWRLARSRPEAEDLFQDVLVKALDRLQELATIAEPGTWLSRVMYNHFVDNRRRFARRRLVSVHDSELADLSLDSLAGGPDPAQLAENRQNMLQLDNALAKLSDAQRLMVLLHDVEGYKMTEIQHITGEPVGTIKSRLHRARARLREILAADATFSHAVACEGVTEDEIDDVPATH